MKRPSIANRPPVALVATLTLVGFLLVVTGTATSAANEHEAPSKQVLVNQILQQQRDVDDLDKAVGQLRGQVTRAQDAAARSSAQQDDANKAQQELSIEAGTTALKGSGVVVNLADAPLKTGGDSAKFDANRIQDSDIQLIVNALFASGAEAIAVNENRVVAVTPIRAAGGTIVVNYRPVNSPYRITALGADSQRFAGTEIVDHFKQWKKKFDLGFSVQKHGDLSVPAYEGRVGIDLAQSDIPTTTTTTTGAPSPSPSTRVTTRLTR